MSIDWGNIFGPLAILGAGASLFGDMRQATYQQAAYEADAQLREVEAQEARDRAAIQVAQLRRDAYRRASQMQANFASQGFTLEGTPVDVLADQAYEEELARQITLYEGATRSLSATNAAAISQLGADAISPLLAGVNGAVNLARTVYTVYPPKAGSSRPSSIIGGK